MTDLNAFYTFALNGVPTATNYALIATAIGPQAGDALCGNLGINQAGVKTVSGTGTVNECWAR